MRILWLMTHEHIFLNANIHASMPGKQWLALRSTHPTFPGILFWGISLTPNT
jgi:hypothetical protein